MSDITSLSYNDSGKRTTTSQFGGSNVFAFAFASASLSVSAGTIFVNSGASLSSGDGAISLTADRNIVLNSGASITTVDGGITLSANASGLATGDFVGLRADNATIQTTGTGNISPDRHRWRRCRHQTASMACRFWMTSVSSTAETTTTAETVTAAGTITIDGTGAAMGLTPISVSLSV